MRSNRKENLMEHSAQVAILAQALAIIKNEKFGGTVDVDKVATIALYHDTGEVLSGDLPTPVKYFNSVITEAYRGIEDEISKKLLSMLPQEFAPSYYGFLNPDKSSGEYKIVKTTDKLAAYLKCIEEAAGGNREFDAAKISIKQKLDEFGSPELKYFLDNFLEGFGQPLDYLN